MSLADAAAALDRALKKSSTVSSRFPPQLPPITPNSSPQFNKTMNNSEKGNYNINSMRFVRRNYQKEMNMESNEFPRTNIRNGVNSANFMDDRVGFAKIPNFPKCQKLSNMNPILEKEDLNYVANEKSFYSIPVFPFGDISRCSFFNGNRPPRAPIFSGNSNGWISEEKFSPHKDGFSCNVWIYSRTRGIENGYDKSCPKPTFMKRYEHYEGKPFGVDSLPFKPNKFYTNRRKYAENEERPFSDMESSLYSRRNFTNYPNVPKFNRVYKEHRQEFPRGMQKNWHNSPNPKLGYSDRNSEIHDFNNEKLNLLTDVKRQMPQSDVSEDLPVDSRNFLRKGESFYEHRSQGDSLTNNYDEEKGTTSVPLNGRVNSQHFEDPGQNSLFGKRNASRLMKEQNSIPQIQQTRINGLSDQQKVKNFNTTSMKDDESVSKFAFVEYENKVPEVSLQVSETWNSSLNHKLKLDENVLSSIFDPNVYKSSTQIPELNSISESRQGELLIPDNFETSSSGSAISSSYPSSKNSNASSYPSSKNSNASSKEDLSKNSFISSQDKDLSTSGSNSNSFNTTHHEENIVIDTINLNCNITSDKTETEFGENEISIETFFTHTYDDGFLSSSPKSESIIDQTVEFKCQTKPSSPCIQDSEIFNEVGAMFDIENEPTLNENTVQSSSYESDELGKSVKIGPILPYRNFNSSSSYCKKTNIIGEVEVLLSAASPLRSPCLSTSKVDQSGGVKLVEVTEKESLVKIENVKPETENSSSCEGNNTMSSCKDQSLNSSNIERRLVPLTRIDRDFQLSENFDFHPLDPSKYKTELCRAFQIKGSCKYGSRCNYAHGLDQLKVSFHHGKYKTRNCEAYHETGYCRYGSRCSFIHDLEEGILKCSIANKEILEALHYWPQDEFSTSATVTWRVFDEKKQKNSVINQDESLVEFTAVPSLKPADVGSISDLDDSNSTAQIYTLNGKISSIPAKPQDVRQANYKYAGPPRTVQHSIQYNYRVDQEWSRRGYKMKELNGTGEISTEEKERSSSTPINPCNKNNSNRNLRSGTQNNANVLKPHVQNNYRKTNYDAEYESWVERSCHSNPRASSDRINQSRNTIPEQASAGAQSSSFAGKQSYKRELAPVKQKKCYSFHNRGFCLYGPECQFVHDD